MITLEHDHLVFRFPQVHENAATSIGFQRTLRLPDDGTTYPLPAGLGPFALRHIDDHAGRLPAGLVRRGGVIMPMWQAEALWVQLGGRYPFAVKIAAGKIDAVTGTAWREALGREPQDYMVTPGQPWLDGFSVGNGTIRQFVAAPLGHGITAEEQLTGLADHGGLQIIVYPMKREAYERLPKTPPVRYHMLARAADASMGLAPGGLMRQEIYRDPHDLDVWDQSVSARCFVTILNAAEWHALTGEAPPTAPITAEEYRRSGIPWFDYYAADLAALPGSEKLAKLDSIKSFAKCGLAEDVWKDQPVATSDPVHLGPHVRRESNVVREAEF